MDVTRIVVALLIIVSAVFGLAHLLSIGSTTPVWIIVVLAGCVAVPGAWVLSRFEAAADRRYVQRRRARVDAEHVDMVKR